MKLTNWCKNVEWSLKRLICYVGCTSCTIAFLKDAAQPGVLGWEIYLAYAFALIMLYAPQLALTVFKIYKGVQGEYKK